MSLCPLHCATFVYEGVVAHVGGREGLSGEVRNPNMDLIMTRRDGASFFTVEGMAYREFCVAAITAPG